MQMLSVDNHYHQSLEVQSLPITSKEIAAWTKKHSILSKVLYLMENGWSTCMNDGELTPYFSSESYVFNSN